MRTAFGIFLILLGATPVLAQHPVEMETGSHIPVPERARIPDDLHVSNVDRSRLVMSQFARCAVARNPAGVQRALRLPFGDSYEHAVSKLATEECLDSGMMKFKATLFRGALFAELYRSRDYAQKHDQPWKVSFDKISFDQEQLAKPGQEAAQWRLLMIFGNCVVGHDEANARTAIMQPTASALEEAALRALGPSFNACLPVGTTLTFSKPIIEGVLAEVLYRGTEAAVQQTAGVK